MAQYDSPVSEIAQQIGASFKSGNLQNAVNDLLNQVGANANVQSDIRSAADAQNSTADALFLRLDEGERGTKETPLQFIDTGREGGRAYIFEGDDGVVASFNTVERVIVGTNGSDEFTVTGDRNTTVDGGAGNDTITASGGDDSIVGGAGDDSISAGAGNDSIYGGAGNDAAVFAGNSADYTVTQDGAIVTVTHNETGDVNKVVNAETLTFGDSSQTVEYSNDVKALVTLYKQLFSDSEFRTQNGEGQADLDGLQYWSDRADQGFSLGDIALGMLNSEEAGSPLASLDLNTSEGITAAIDLLYTEILGRPAAEIDAEGRDYWIAEAEQGATLADIATGFMASQELQDQTVQANDWDFLI